MYIYSPYTLSTLFRTSAPVNSQCDNVILTVDFWYNSSWWCHRAPLSSLCDNTECHY